MSVFLGSNEVSLFGGVSTSGNFTATEIPSNANINNYTNEGMFFYSDSATVSTVTNIPLSAPFALLVEKHSGVKQTISFSSTLKTFIRNYDGSTWTSWIQLYNASFKQETVDKLTTARKINEVLFDGTQDIIIEDNTKLLSTDVINATNVSVAGKALDARQANPNEDGSLAAQISTLNENLASTNINVSALSNSVSNLIKTLTFSSSTDSNGNVGVLGAGLGVVISACLDSNYDYLPIVFQSAVSNAWYAHITTFDGSKLSSGVTISGKAYYI